MATVEELKARLLRVDKTPLYCAAGQCGFTEGKHIPTPEELDFLIAAAEAQGEAKGRAEGAEQMKETIRNNGELIKRDESMSGVEGKWASCVESRGEIEDMTATLDVFVIPASLLAPAKEEVKP